MLAGSGIYAVVYSSVTVWCALLSRVVLGRVLLSAQWISIFVVVAGLAVTGLDAQGHGSKVVLGTIMILCGAILHATCHVLTEFLSVKGTKIPSHINGFAQGLTNSVLVALWQCTYTASHFDLISEPMEDAGTTWPMAIVLLSGLALSNFVHAGCFFYLLTRIGNVSTGIAKAMQAMAVFAMAHYVYGPRDPSQRFTPLKFLSLFIVMSGVLGYGISTAKQGGKGH
jgi:drug/metabolite transporter (DMT)-like permease